ncbi:MAG: TAG lipase/steryl ester hydrolase/phospholipase A2/LPA acyltransferase [Flavobacterium sp.]|jgi:TAG lipase/steryl ester hydrolase/phospholipase A2/LPA acyltransferase
MVSSTATLSRIDREIRRSTHYEQWLKAAHQHDEQSGGAKWRADPSSKVYDFNNIQSRLDDLRQLRAQKDDVGLLFALNEGIHGNQGGMGKSDLYEKSLIGTKDLISDYVNEIVDALNHIHQLKISKEINEQDKLDFFHRAQLCFGRSALMLSGAGSLGHFHHGVVRTLFSQNLLPHVISGSSAGSVFAAILGTHSDLELEELLFTEGLAGSIKDDGKTKPWGLIRPQVDSETLKNLLEKMIPDITFQEAYEKTGRMISITIAPLEEHQTSRLMNAITSPNVFIRSAVMASCAVPGIFPPVMLMAKNVYGKRQPYLPNRRWVDGAVTDDLPAKRLARLYGVNHYIVSQANPLALAMMSTDKYVPLPDVTKSIIRHSTKELLKSGEKLSRRWLRQVPNAGKAMSMFYSVMAQDYSGDVNIAPSFNFVDPQKLLGQLTDKEINELILDGERATWPQLERLRICTKIGSTLESILSDHGSHNVKHMYKKVAT